MTAADDLTAVWAEAADIIAENLHADTYEVVRATPVSDNSGGTTLTDVVVETGRCRLTVANRLGGERASGDVVLAISLYVAQLPYESVVMETDRLRINGRVFQVTDVKRGGLHGLFTEASLEERT